MISALAYALVGVGAALGAAFLASSSETFVSSAAAVQLFNACLGML